MATLRELVTIWGFEIDDKPLARLEERIHGIKETFLHLGEVLAGVITGEGGGILGLGIATAHAGIEATRLSQSLGVTVDKIQSLQYAAKLSHIEMTSLTSAMRVLSLHTVRAAQGSAESIMAFSKAGMGVPSQLETTDKLLMRIADRFKNMADGQQKVGIATELMGRGGAFLIPLLNKGSQGIQEMIDKARAYGAILDGPVIAAGKEFYEVTEEGQLALIGLKNTIGAGLLPALTKMVHGLLDWYAANRAIIQTKLAGFFEELVPQLEAAGKMLMGLAGLAWDLAGALGGIKGVLAAVLGILSASAAAKMVGFFFDLTKGQDPCTPGRWQKTGWSCHRWDTEHNPYMRARWLEDCRKYGASRHW